MPVIRRRILIAPLSTEENQSSLDQYRLNSKTSPLENRVHIAVNEANHIGRNFIWNKNTT